MYVLVMQFFIIPPCLKEVFAGAKKGEPDRFKYPEGCHNHVHLFCFFFSFQIESFIAKFSLPTFSNELFLSPALCSGCRISLSLKNLF